MPDPERIPAQQPLPQAAGGTDSAPAAGRPDRPDDPDPIAGYIGGEVRSLRPELEAKSDQSTNNQEVATTMSERRRLARPEADQHRRPNQGGWDDNPGILVIDYNQELVRREQEAASLDQQRRGLAESLETARAGLDRAGDQERRQQLEQRLAQFDQQLDWVGRRIVWLEAELKTLSREIGAVSRPAGKNDQVPQAA